MTTSRYRALGDEQWEQIELVLPSNAGRRGRPFNDNRRAVEGIIYRLPHRDPVA